MQVGCVCRLGLGGWAGSTSWTYGLLGWSTGWVLGLGQLVGAGVGSTNGLLGLQAGSGSSGWVNWLGLGLGQLVGFGAGSTSWIYGFLGLGAGSTGWVWGLGLPWVGSTVGLGLLLGWV